MKVRPLRAAGAKVPSSAGRPPPAAPDAEAAVLSSCLLSPEALEKVRGSLESDHFYDPRHRLVYGAILELREAGRVIDTVMVAGVLRGVGRLEQAGGAAYLAELVDATPAVAHVEDHARVIRQKWQLRSLIAACQRVAAEGYGDVDGQALLGEAIKSLQELTEPEKEQAPIRVRELAAEMALPDEPIDWLWSERHQIAPGRPTILGAYGGLGKTWVVLAAALSVATGIPFLGSPPVRTGRAIVLSYETGRRRLLRRLRRLVHGYGVAEGLEQLQFAAQEDIGAFLSDPTTEAHLVALCSGARLLVVDALLQGSPGLRENDAEIAGPLHMLGRVSARTDCAVLVIHHERKTSEETSGAPVAQALRGHSGIHAALDAAWSMRPLTGDLVALRPAKVSDGAKPRGWDIAITDTDGGGIVVSWRDAPEAQGGSSDAGTERSVARAAADAVTVAKVLLARPGAARDPDNAAREFGAQFVLGGSGLFFGPELLKAAVIDDLEPQRAAPPGSMVSVGGDIGLVTDASAIVAVAEREGVFTLCDAEERRPQKGQPLKLSSVVEDFCAFCGRYGESSITVDHHELEAGREHLPQGFSLTPCAGGGEAKTARFLKARELFRQSAVRIPRPLVRLTNQLSLIVSKPRPGGGVSIILPRRQGTHLDLASAFILALDAAAGDSGGAGRFLRAMKAVDARGENFDHLSI